MASSPVINPSSATLVFGDQDFTSILAVQYTQSSSITNSADKSEAKDNNGTTLAVAFFDPKQDVTIKQLITGSVLAALPKDGDVVAFTPAGGTAQNMLVWNNKSEKNSKWAMLDMTLRRYVGQSTNIPA